MNQAITPMFCIIVLHLCCQYIFYALIGLMLVQNSDVSFNFIVSMFLRILLVYIYETRFNPIKCGTWFHTFLLKVAWQQGNGIMSNPGIVAFASRSNDACRYVSLSALLMFF